MGSEISVEPFSALDTVAMDKFSFLAISFNVIKNPLKALNPTFFLVSITRAYENVNKYPYFSEKSDLLSFCNRNFHFSKFFRENRLIFSFIYDKVYCGKEKYGRIGYG